jgi:hypothetical protein
MKVAFAFSVATLVSVAVATAPAFFAVLSARVSAESCSRKIPDRLLERRTDPCEPLQDIFHRAPHDRNYVTSGSNSIRNQRLVVGHFDWDGY